MVVGWVKGPAGTEGVVRVAVLTDFPQRFAPGAVLFLRGERVEVRDVRWHRGDALVQFAEVSSREQAEQLRDAEITIPEEALQTLPEGSYYHYHLLGLRVVTVAGEELGEVVDILQTGSNDVFVVRNAAGEEVLLPAIEDVVKRVELDEGRIVVELLDGL